MSQQKKVVVVTGAALGVILEHVSSPEEGRASLDLLHKVADEAGVTLD